MTQQSAPEEIWDEKETTLGGKPSSPTRGRMAKQGALYVALKKRGILQPSGQAEIGKGMLSGKQAA